MTESAIRRVGVVLKTTSPEAAEVGKHLLTELERLGLEAVIDRESARVLGSTDDVEREDLPSLVDVIVVLGGDGTLLSVTHGEVAGTPILGINMGTLGFLTEHPAENLVPMLHATLDGKAKMVRRERLKVTVETPDEKAVTHCVLNDAVVNKSALARMVVMYLAREYTNLTLSQIGAELGGRDHSTISHGANKITRDVLEDPYVEQAVTQISRLLK